jgi:hypothetical protein
MSIIQRSRRTSAAGAALIAALATAAATISLAAGPAVARHADPLPTAESAPVVVELFTSEGCSDCPPADAVLAEIARQSPVPGVQILALEEHVDYWDSKKWRDPFSSAALTARQNEYAAAFHHDEVYTPQMVVDGTTEFVGSQAETARAAITRAARAAKATVLVTPESDGMVAVHVSHLPAGTAVADVFAATTEDGLSSSVSGGENAGRRLSHSAVVRSLERIGEMTAGEPFSARFPVGVDGVSRSRHVIVFVQDNKTRRIVGAGQAG